jgi:hypothetical protein
MADPDAYRSKPLRVKRRFWSWPAARVGALAGGERWS